MPYLTIPNGRAFYTDFQPKVSPPRATLILHHGLGSTHAFYRSITPALTASPHNFRCISYDTISSGLSDLPSGPQSMQGFAQDAIDVLDALSVTEKAIFVGHSMGGVVASEIAVTKGDRIKASVMLGPPLPSATLTKTIEGRAKAVEEGGMEAMADTIPTGATGSKSTPLQHAFIRTLLLSTRPEGYCSMCKALASASPPDYAAIEMPTLMIAGEEDKSAPLPECQEIFARTGGEKSMEVVKAMGHWFCIEDPDAIAKLIGAFVEKVIKVKP